MEPILIFFIIIVLFNVINGLLRKDKDKARRAPMTVRMPPESFHERDETGRIGPIFEDDYLEEPVAVEKPAERTIRLRKLKQERAEMDHKAAQAPPPEPARRPVNTAVSNQLAAAPSLENMFAGRSNILAGFIFHEIMQPPLSNRKRKGGSR